MKKGKKKKGLKEQYRRRGNASQLLKRKGEEKAPS